MTQANAHPHLSCDGHFAVVHNGIISNYHALRTELQRRGHRFASETDTEVFAPSHWARQFHVVGGLVPMLDVVYLLKQARSALHWDRILDWVRGSAAGTHLYLMLTDLQTHRLIDLPSEVLHGLFVQQRACGHLNATVLYSLIDRYLADGKPFGPVLSQRNLEILWQTLLLPGPPLRNLMLAPWNVYAPSRLRLRA